MYFIIAHHLPEQLERLVATIKTGSPAARIVLCLERSNPEMNEGEFQNIQGVDVLKNNTEGRWGDFSLVEKVLKALTWICQNIDVEWIFFLSGQDYPIANLSEIEKFYIESGYDAFISGVSIEDKRRCDQVACGKGQQDTGISGCPDCKSRYYYRYYDISGAVRFAGRLPLVRSLMKRFMERYSKNDLKFRIRSYPFHKGGNFLLGIRNKKLFSSGLKCYKGLCWFAMNLKCLEKMLEFIRKNPGYKRHYQRTIIPDESFFATILFNLPGLKVCNENYRFIEWKNHKAANPEILKNEQFDRIINSGKHFARKFDIKVDNVVINRLFEYIQKEQH